MALEKLNKTLDINLERVLTRFMKILGVGKGFLNEHKNYSKFNIKTIFIVEYEDIVILQEELKDLGYVLADWEEEEWWYNFSIRVYEWIELKNCVMTHEVE